MAFKTFANGFPLPASDLNNFLMKQSVIVFANAAARTAALPEPTEGMVTYLEDTNVLEVFTGASFVPVSEVSPITTQGDLIIGDASGDPVRLAVGAADTVLTSNGTTLSFAAPAGGGGFTEIASGTMSGATVNITSIPTGNKFLRLQLDKVLLSAAGEMTMKINNDSGTNYNWTRIVGNISTSAVLPFRVSNNMNSANPSNGFFDFGEYEDATSDNPLTMIGSFHSKDSIFRQWFIFGAYYRTAAITEINLSLDGVQTFTGGTFKLFGVN